MAARKEGVSMGGGYYTDLKKFDPKTRSREMFIMKKNAAGSYTVLGTYKYKPETKTPISLHWAKTPKTDSEERAKIAKQIDIYEKVK
jgi:hypothetical protein